MARPNRTGICYSSYNHNASSNTWGHLVVSRHICGPNTRKAIGSLRRPSCCFVAGTVWLSCITFGFWLLLSHNTDDGSPDLSENSTGTNLVRDVVHKVLPEHLGEILPPPGKLHVVMALHPKCPCTKTSLEVLGRLLAIDSDSTYCSFLVSLPSDQSVSWIDTPITKLAMSLPNASLAVDVEAKRAHQLGLMNSGSVILVQSDGSVTFRGGITSGRTCSDESPGSVNAASLIRREIIAAITTPTFGFPLQ